MKSQIFPSGVGGDQNRAKRRVNIRLTFIWWSGTRLWISDNVAGCVNAGCVNRQLFANTLYVSVVLTAPKGSNIWAVFQCCSCSRWSQCQLLNILFVSFSLTTHHILKVDHIFFPLNSQYILAEGWYLSGSTFPKQGTWMKILKKHA